MSVAARPRRGLRGLRHLLAPLCLAMILGACAADLDDRAAQNPAADRRSPENLAQMLRELRKDSRLRDAAALYCSASLPQSEATVYKPFLASFFNVPRDEAGLTLCRVLIEAVVSDELTEQDIAKIEDPQSSEDFVTFGVVLRKMLVAQERLDSQQVGRPPVIAASPDGSPSPPPAGPRN